MFEPGQAQAKPTGPPNQRATRKISRGARKRPQQKKKVILQGGFQRERSSPGVPPENQEIENINLGGFPYQKKEAQ